MKRVAAIVSFLAVSASAAAQEVSLSDLPLCTGKLATRSVWQQVTYQGYELLVPSELRPTASLILDHGGRELAGGGLTVRLALGLFGRSSFGTPNSDWCRLERAGARTALLIERVSSKESSVTVWVPGLRSPATHYAAIVTARSSREQDLPLLRSIAASLAVAPH